MLLTGRRTWAPPPPRHAGTGARVQPQAWPTWRQNRTSASDLDAIRILSSLSWELWATLLIFRLPFHSPLSFNPDRAEILTSGVEKLTLTSQENQILPPCGRAGSIKKRSFHLFTSQNIVLTYLFKLMSFQQTSLPAEDNIVTETGNT